MFRLSTFNSENSPFIFSLRVTIFLLPILLVGIFYEIILWNSGESWPISRIVEEQSRNPDLVWRRNYFSQFAETYKFLLVKQARKEILVVGSSRVLNFRSIFFHPFEGMFMNGGRLLSNLGDVASFADSLETGALPKPEVLIVGLDPWWLKQGSRVPRGFDPANLPEDAWEVGAHVSAITGLISNGSFPFQLLKPGQNLLTPFCNRPARGLAALFNGSAYRSDGSTLHEKVYADFLENPKYRDRENPPIIERVRALNGRFKPCPGIDPQKIDFLLKHLENLRHLGIEIVVFFPPFSDEVAAEISEIAELRKWWKDYWDLVPEILTARGFQIFGVSNPSVLGLDDRYMLDGFHPSEVLVAAILVDWLENVSSSSILASIDIGWLKSLSKNPRILPVGFGCDISEFAKYK
ncbi:MAG: hypothetical protein U5R49_06620 [Deltaproteobacteria bacterium]|nr:hypothetical protein [Deltaproteobacteria bacterium]